MVTYPSHHPTWLFFLDRDPWISTTSYTPSFLGFKITVYRIALRLTEVFELGLKGEFAKNERGTGLMR